jgi:hypothetical protein
MIYLNVRYHGKEFLVTMFVFALTIVLRKKGSKQRKRQNRDECEMFSRETLIHTDYPLDA